MKRIMQTLSIMAALLVIAGCTEAARKNQRTLFLSLAEQQAAIYVKNHQTAPEHAMILGKRTAVMHIGPGHGGNFEYNDEPLAMPLSVEETSDDNSSILTKEAAGVAISAGYFGAVESGLMAAAGTAGSIAMGFFGITDMILVLGKAATPKGGTYTYTFPPIPPIKPTTPPADPNLTTMTGAPEPPQQPAATDPGPEPVVVSVQRVALEETVIHEEPVRYLDKARYMTDGSYSH